MKNITTLLLIIGISYGLSAQNEMDALRYSNLGFGGTAKYMGAAGAYGALGGDASTLSVNPAGIGVFKKSEINLSMALYSSHTESNYMGRFSDDLKYNFNIPNFSVIGTFKLGKNTPWKSINLGFGSNRLANFHNRVDIYGKDVAPTIINSYLEDANMYGLYDLDPFSSELAYYSYLIDTANNAFEFFSPYANLDMQQRLSIETRGAINETYLTMGGNYEDRFYLGVTIGLPSIRYIEETTYFEENTEGVTDLNELKVNDYLKTTGSGINAKIGCIYKPFQFLRLGAAVHTPTYYYQMRDEYSSSMSTTYIDPAGQYSAESERGIYNYELSTPFRAVGSIGLVFKKIGFISADIEHVNYANARFRAGGDPFFDVKDAIKNTFTYSRNYRIGGELNLTPIALRAGYALYGSPYKEGLNDASKAYYTFGFGIKGKSTYLDFAYILSNAQEDYYIHQEVSQPAKNTLKTNNIVASFGVRF